MKLKREKYISVYNLHARENAMSDMFRDFNFTLLKYEMSYTSRDH